MNDYMCLDVDEISKSKDCKNICAAFKNSSHKRQYEVENKNIVLKSRCLPGEKTKKVANENYVDSDHYDDSTTGSRVAVTAAAFQNESRNYGYPNPGATTNLLPSHTVEPQPSVMPLHTNSTAKFNRKNENVFERWNEASFGDSNCNENVSTNSPISPYIRHIFANASSSPIYEQHFFENNYPTICAAETDIFCMVPGRTSLLSSTAKYHVTVGEIQRRISPPECLNASLLGGILRKAKSKDGGKALRDSLKRVGLTLPAGRRKAATVTCFTALVEEEAMQLAKDFSVLCKKEFPVVSLAEFISKQNFWHSDCDFFPVIDQASFLLKLIADSMRCDRSPILGQHGGTLMPPVLQQKLAHFSMVTHGFGKDAFIAVLDTVLLTLDEVLRNRINHRSLIFDQMTHDFEFDQQKVLYNSCFGQKNSFNENYLLDSMHGGVLKK